MSRAAVAAFVVLVMSIAATPAQRPKEAKITPPDNVTRSRIRNQLDQLKTAVGVLRDRNISDDIVVEVEVFAKAADWILRYDEWHHADAAAHTLAALAEGLRRAEEARLAKSGWRNTREAATIRAYRSKVDGSAQPYALSKPRGYGDDPNKAWRLDIVLHGRDASLNEVKFMHGHRGDNKTYSANYVQLEPLGRGNNAYRWAGETDVFEAIDSFLATEQAAGRGQCIDRHRVVLRGFSMGGAGSWHLGLHHPHRWCAVGPGAGFSQTHGYLKDIPNPLPSPQEECLRIYDAVAYAENARMVPVVAYAGGKDPQIAAAKAIESKLKPLNIPMTFLVAPDQEHRMPPEWQKKAEAEYAKHVRAAYPNDVHFVTYTLGYRQCEWIDILRLKKHYERAEVNANHANGNYTITTSNIERLRLRVPDKGPKQVTVSIDGTKLTYPDPRRDAHGVILLERVDGVWQADRSLTDTGKAPGLQGPIDDAFTGPFLCVRPTGRPWHRAVNDHALATLDQFGKDWPKWMRGTLPEKNDTEVSDDDVRDKHLILFGDPGSNMWVERALSRLPLKWEKATLNLGGRSFDAKKSVPVLICRNPLNPERYLVLNSGHTFHEADFRGTNALLYPRLGDCAVLEAAPTPGDPAAARVLFSGLFDETWRRVR